MRPLLLIALAGCGRFQFDRIPPDAAHDAVPSRCANGFAEVPGDPQLGTTDFCVMQFEAKAKQLATGVIEPLGCDAACNPNSFVGTHAPASVPDGKPWNTIDTVSAYAGCKAAGLHLLTNREWMTMARNAERTAANWSGGAAGVGRLVEGNSENGYLAVTNAEDPYSDTGNSAADPPDAGWEQRRTIVLSNNSVIWDMPGNFQEWIDWSAGDPLDGPPTPCNPAELPAFTCTGYTDDDFNSAARTLDSTVGAGQILGGAGNAARRGGQGTDKVFRYAGIYGMNMNRFTTEVFDGTSFRCALGL